MSGQNIDGNSNKINFLHYLIIAALASAFACFSFVSVTNVYSYYLLRISQLLVYLVFGYVCLSVLKKKWVIEKNVQPIIIIAQLFFTVLFVLVVFYFVTNKSQILIAVSSSAVFILPFVLFYNYDVYASIPSKQYKALPHPTSLVVEKAIVFVNSVTLKFKLKVSPEDEKAKVFETVVPAQMALGEIFKAFLIHQKNNNVVITQPIIDSKEVGWIFFKVAFWGLFVKSLDPSLNIWDNKVKPGSRISVQRVAYSMSELVENDKLISNGSN